MNNKEVFTGGLERIRTAVDGFADHCLATRPRDPFIGNSKLTISVRLLVIPLLQYSPFL